MAPHTSSCPPLPISSLSAFIDAVDYRWAPDNARHLDIALARRGTMALLEAVRQRPQEGKEQFHA